MKAYRLAALFLCAGLVLASGDCVRGEENPRTAGKRGDIPSGEEESERPPGSGERDILEEAVVRTVLEQEKGRFLPGEF